MHKVYAPNNGERILATLATENDDIEIYTVPADHNFYLEEANLNIELNGPNSGFGYIYWMRGGDMYYVRDICQIWIYTAEVNGRIMTGAMTGDHSVFPSFLRLAANDMLRIVSAETGLIAEGNISGFLVEEPG